jgi:hypothetical protein
MWRSALKDAGRFFYSKMQEWNLKRKCKIVQKQRFKNFTHQTTHAIITSNFKYASRHRGQFDRLPTIR